MELGKDNEVALGYRRNESIGEPFSRRALVAIVLCCISGAMLVLLWVCQLHWLVRPSTVETVRAVWMWSGIATVAVGVRWRRVALIERGKWVQAVAVSLAVCSCCAGLPLMGPAREIVDYRFEHANRDHFMKIGKALRTHSERHGRFPEHLAVLVAAGDIGPADLVDPFSGTTAAVLPGGIGPADWRKIVPLIDAHCDYVYAGAGLPVGVDDDVIVIVDKPVGGRPGRLVRDAISEWFIGTSELRARFEADAAARRRQGLPVVSF